MGWDYLSSPLPSVQFLSKERGRLGEGVWKGLTTGIFQVCWLLRWRKISQLGLVPPDREGEWTERRGSAEPVISNQRPVSCFETDPGLGLRFGAQRKEGKGTSRGIFGLTNGIEKGILKQKQVLSPRGSEGMCSG